MHPSRTTRNRPGRSAVLWATVLTVVAPAFSQQLETGTSEPTDTGSGVDVILKTVEPGVLRGRLVSLTSSDGATVLVDGDSPRPRKIPMADLVRITAVGFAREARPESRFASTDLASLGDNDVRLSLVGDDVLIGSVVGGRADALLLKTEAFGPVRVPLDAIAGIDTSRAALPTFSEAVAWLDRSPRRGADAPGGADDRVLLTNADVVRGFITRIDPEGITVDTGQGEARLPQRLVVAVRFAALRQPPRKGPHAIVTCPGTGRLTLAELEWSGWTVRGRWTGEEAVETDAQHILRVDFEGGRWEWLSDQPPMSAEQIPMLSLAWEPRIDRNVLGGPIIVSGETFQRGIGVHSRSSLTFDLKGVCAQFVTLFGLDDSSGSLGDVDVTIRVDGQQRYTEGGVRRGRLYGPVRLDVAGARRIELLVDFGDNGDLQDRFNWIEPALIR